MVCHQSIWQGHGDKNAKQSNWKWVYYHIDSLVQERRKIDSSALAIELRLSRTNPSIYLHIKRTTKRCTTFNHYTWFAKIKITFLAVTSPVWHTSASNYLSQIVSVILWQYPFVPPVNPTYKDAKWNQWIWTSTYGKCVCVTSYDYYYGAFSLLNFCKIRVAEHTITRRTYP